MTEITPIEWSIYGTAIIIGLALMLAGGPRGKRVVYLGAGMVVFAVTAASLRAVMNFALDF